MLSLRSEKYSFHLTLPFAFYICMFKKIQFFPFLPLSKPEADSKTIVDFRDIVGICLSSEQINHYSFSFQPRIYFSVFWVFVRWELHGSAVIFKQWRQKIKQPICTPIRWGRLQQGFESCDTVLKNLINSTCTLLKIIILRWKFKFQLLFINKLYGKCLF